MSTNGTSTVDQLEQLAHQVREEYAAAAAANQDPPGRPTLIKKLANPPEISTHLVRKAKELVDASLASPPPADASVAPAAPAATASEEPVQTAGGDPGPAVASPTPPAPALVTPAHQPTASRWSWLVKLRHQRWALILMGIGAGFSVWSGWVGLGEMCGYGPVRPLPGIWDGLTVNSAIVLPLSVEAYGTYALRIWLTHTTRSKAARVYACVSAFASLAVGGAAQVAYHELTAYGYVKPPWQVVMSVALVPVVVLALASILAYLARTVRQGGGQA